MRLPKQVLVIPYKIEKEDVKYCVFKRTDLDVWQFVAGGQEDFDKTILDAAKREFFEETGIVPKTIVSLEEYTKIPVVNVVKDFLWGDDVYYSEEFAFAVKIDKEEIKLSVEHKEYKWLEYDEVRKLLKYDSNKSALWELDTKIKRGIIS